MLKKLALSVLIFYKLHISPYLPISCRFTPTCSVYTMHAIKKYGVFKGSAMGFWRILRCNPFNKHTGHDPVK